MRKTTKMVAVLAAMSVMVLGAATMVSAAEKKNGWAKEGSDWYYYVEDNQVKNQWALSGDDWYFLDEDGKMATEVFIDNTVPEVVDVRDWDPTILADEVMFGDLYDYYYVKADGAMATGWENVKKLDELSPIEGDGKAWFYFGANGIMYANTWVLSNDVWYFMGDDGKMLSNTLLTDWDNNDYLLKKDGSMVTGWYKVESDSGNDTVTIKKNDWVYADKNGALASDGWTKVSGKWYYFGVTSKGAAVSNSAVNGVADAKVTNAYAMESNGFIEYTTVRPNSNGEYVTKVFYLTKSGAMETGLFKISDIVDNKRVTDTYIADKDGTILTGVQAVSGKYYLFDSITAIRDEEAKYAVDGVAHLFANDREAKDYLDNLSGKHKIHKLGTATMWSK